MSAFKNRSISTNPVSVLFGRPSARLGVFAAACLALGAATAPAALASEEKMEFSTHFMASWDANSDGKVTVEEATTRRTDIFASFDSDDNGVLTEPELALMDEMRASQHENVEGHGGQGKGMGQGKGHGEGMGQGKGMGHGKGHGEGMGQKMGQGMGDGQGAGRFQQTAEAGMHDRKGIDANGDGTIAKDEFVGMTAAWFARLDANGDGAITDADF